MKKLQQVLASKPDDIEALCHIGTIYEMFGITEQAVETSTHLAKIYHQTNQFLLALSYYHKAEKLATSDQQAELLKTIEKLQHEDLHQFEEAYHTSRQIVAFYLTKK